jgi:dihydrofolate reductase
MRKVLLFMFTSLDGFFEGPGQDITWHNFDDEMNQLSIEQLDSVDMLLFGRVTYEMMASYWPTSAAMADDPLTTEKMNTLPKLVFSKTLHEVEWQNTRLVKDNFVEEVTQLKAQPGKDLIIFGSSDLAVTFLEHDLLDEIRVMVNPIVLGGGKALFAGIKQPLKLKLLKTRAFASGNVLLHYQPVKE